MPINDPLGDLLSRIRNAQMRNKSKVSSPSSKLRESVLEVLKSEGYIRGYAVVERDGRSEIEIELKYFDGEPVIREIERISKPGRRVYTSVKNLPRVNNGLGVDDSCLDHFYCGRHNASLHGVYPWPQGRDRAGDAEYQCSYRQKRHGPERQ